MRNLSFIVEISKDTENLQHTLENLKENVIIGDEVILHIDPIDVNDENLEIINKYEAISERYNKYTKHTIVSLVKLFAPIDINIENRCCHQSIYYVTLDLNKEQINTLRK